MKKYQENKPVEIVYGTEPLGPEIIAKLDALEGKPFDAYWDDDKGALMISVDEFKSQDSSTNSV